MNKFKIGDVAYISVASPELKGQKVTIASGQIGTGERAYRQVEDSKGKLYAIEIRLLRDSSRKPTPKKKAAPAKPTAASKAKPKAKSKAKPAAKAKPVANAKPATKAKPAAKPASKPKATAKGKDTVCVTLFNATDTKEAWDWYRKQVKKYPKATSEQRAKWKSQAMSSQYPGTRK